MDARPQPEPETARDRRVPICPGFEETPEPEAMRVVRLVGGGPGDGSYRIPHQIPQVVTVGGAAYDLGDRGAGVYHWRSR